MKKIIFVFIFLTTTLIVKAQMGIGFYPLGSMASVRWNPRHFERDSSKIKYVTNYNYHFELRSTFNIGSHNNGVRVSAQPEFGFYHRVAGTANGPMLLSGVGFLTAISNNNVTSAGAFLPLVIEYVPQFDFTHNICFNLETDLLMSANRNHFTTRFRPLFSVAWIFSSPAPKQGSGKF